MVHARCSCDEHFPRRLFFYKGFLTFLQPFCTQTTQYVRNIMATSSASRPHKRARVTHETIHRPYQNPNHAESYFSNRGRIRDIQRRLRLEASRAKKPVEAHIHEERRTKEARLPADKKREYERELIELLRDEAIKEAEKKRNLVMRRYKKVKFIGKSDFDCKFAWQDLTIS
jgi:hypothetical protein